MVVLFYTVQADGEGKTEAEDSPNKMMTVVPANVAGTVVGPVVSSGMTTALELKNPSKSAPQPCSVLPGEAWLQVWLAYNSS